MVLDAGPMGLYMVNALRGQPGPDLTVVTLDRLEDHLPAGEVLVG